MNAFFATLKKVERGILILLMLVLIIVCFAQVFFRLVLYAPLAWTEEVARYTFVWLTFIGAAVVISDHGHFHVDILTSKCPPRIAFALRIFSYACMLFYAYIMIFYGWTLLTKVYHQRSAALTMSMSIPYTALPLSGVLMVVHLIENIIKDFHLTDATPLGEQP